MSEWKPIETAPKDGTLIAGLCGNVIHKCRWMTAAEAASNDCGEIEDYVSGWDDFEGDYCYPKYWMPWSEIPA